MPGIYFRTDGNEEIAIGHVMRCLSIARACRDLHAEICFLVSDEKSMAILKERFDHPNEFSVQCLHSNYKDPESELSSLQSILKNSSSAAHQVYAPVLFIDSYFVTETYLSELRKFYHVAYIDDMLLFDYPVDLIINYDMDYEPACYHKAGRKLLGAAYTPLREQFQNIFYEVRPNVQNILISTGGTDAYNVACSFLKCVPKNECHYHVITSRLNTHFQELMQLASIYPTIHIHENVSNMAALMCKCDLALSAGGTTLCELCAVGVPTISFVTADNQLGAVETFSAKGIIPYAGDVRSSLENVIHTVKRFLAENSASYELRKKNSKTMRYYIDGSGASRIAAELMQPYL